MSAHQPSPTPEGRGGTPITAVGRADHEAREAPSMNELLAAGAAASAVSTPPDAAEEARQGKPAPSADEPAGEDEAGPAGSASTGGRDAA